MTVPPSGNKQVNTSSSLSSQSASSRASQSFKGASVSNSLNQMGFQASLLPRSPLLNVQEQSLRPLQHFLFAASGNASWLEVSSASQEMAQAIAHYGGGNHIYQGLNQAMMAMREELIQHSQMSPGLKIAVDAKLQLLQNMLEGDFEAQLYKDMLSPSQWLLFDASYVETVASRYLAQGALVNMVEFSQHLTFLLGIHVLRQLGIEANAGGEFDLAMTHQTSARFTLLAQTSDTGIPAEVKSKKVTSATLTKTTGKTQKDQQTAEVKKTLSKASTLSENSKAAKDRQTVLCALTKPSKNQKKLLMPTPAVPTKPSVTVKPATSKPAVHSKALVPLTESTRATSLIKAHLAQVHVKLMEIKHYATKVAGISNIALLPLQKMNRKVSIVEQACTANSTQLQVKVNRFNIEHASHFPLLLEEEHFRDFYKEHSEALRSLMEENACLQQQVARHSQLDACKAGLERCFEEMIALLVKAYEERNEARCNLELALHNLNKGTSSLKRIIFKPKPEKVTQLQAVLEQNQTMFKVKEMQFRLAITELMMKIPSLVDECLANMSDSNTTP